MTGSAVGVLGEGGRDGMRESQQGSSGVEG
jgi:hypothetical protein